MDDIKKTGRFGFLFGIRLEDNESQIMDRSAAIVARQIGELVKDGRDFLIRTRRTLSDSENVGTMFANDVKRYKVVTWIALESYNQAQIGECAFLPPDTGIEWFTRPDTYTDDEGKEQPMRVSIAKVGKLWFEEDFIMEYNRQTYRRIEPPDEAILITDGKH